MTWESVVSDFVGLLGLFAGFAIALFIVAILGYWETRR